MKSNSESFLLIIVLAIGFIKANEIKIAEVIENLNTLKILKEIQTLDTNTHCTDDVKEYVKNLLSNKLWALKMYDSSAQIPNGLLLQNKWFLGHFDECIAVKHPEGNFAGKYCLMNVNINLGNNSIVPKIFTYQPKEDTISKLELLYGICLPSTCSHAEINETMYTIFNFIFMEDAISVDVKEENCQTKESIPELFTCSNWGEIAFLGFSVVIALVSTWYDVYQQYVSSKKNPNSLLASFSLYSNGKELFKTSKNSSQLEVLNGIRVFSMIWVVLIHGYALMMYFSPVVDRVGVSKRIIDYGHVVTLNGYLAVDTFLFLSGLLICIVFSRDVTKKGYYDVPLAYIHRYIRLTPPYAFVMFITATIFPYFGNGPIWRRLSHTDSESCKKHWWLGLLYVQNYVSPYEQCLSQSWYLAVDMQLHWISPLILFPIFLWSSLAPVILGVVILGSACITFAIAYSYDLGPTIDVTTNPYQIGLEYKPFHTRAAPWLVGVALGYAINRIKAKNIKIKLSKFWVLIGWLASTAICLGSLYGFVNFTHSEYTTLEAASYLAFHRLGWGLGLAWIVFACAYDYGGPVNTFLSWRIFQPLGKLTYCVYLIHLKFQYYRIGTSRVNVLGDDYETIYFILGDVVIIFLASIPMTLLYEMPFRNLYGYFFQNVQILPISLEKKKKNKIEEEEFDFDDAGIRKEIEKEKFLE